MLVTTRSGGMRRASAHTGPPAWPSTTFRPTAFTSVDFPDMFDPVTSRNEPAGPTSTSLRTQSSGARRGWPSARARSVVTSASSVGMVQSG